MSIHFFDIYQKYHANNPALETIKMKPPSKKIVALLISFALNGCGGGEKSNSSQDSQNFKININGIAAIGAPLTNQILYFTCKSGNVFTTITDSNGKYSIGINDDFPCLANASISSELQLKSFTHKNGNLNITPITTLGYQVANGDISKIDAATDKLKNSLQNDIGVFFDDPFFKNFVANQSGLDFEIEKFNSRIASLYPLNNNLTQQGSLDQRINLYASDIKNNITPSSLLNDDVTNSKIWLSKIAEKAWVVATTKASATIDTSKFSKADFVSRVTGNAAVMWNVYAGQPIDKWIESSNTLGEQLGELLSYDSINGWSYDSSKLGSVMWTTGVGITQSVSIGLPMTPGKGVGVACNLGTSFTTNENISFDTAQKYCETTSDVAGIAFDIKEIYTTAPKIIAAAQKFKYTWLTQFNNNTLLMDLGRKRSVKDFFKNSWLAAQDNISITNGLLDVRNEYIDILSNVYKLSQSDIDATLPLPTIKRPLAPTLTDLGSGTVRSSWAAISGANGYELYRNATKVATLGTTTQYEESGLSAGAQACYKVRALANGLASQFSPESCVTLATIKCSGTWNNTQYSVGATEATTQACQAGYTGNKTLSHICQASGQWGATTTQDNCTLTPAPTCTGSWSSAKYLVGQTEEKNENTCPAGTQGQVRSWHTCQASGSSAVWGGLSQSDNCTAYLATPTGIYASSVSGGVQITWDGVSGATSYNLYKSGSLYRSNITSTSYVDSYVTNGVTYSYSVSSYSNYNGQNVTSPVSGSYSVVYRDGQTGVSPPTNVSAAQYNQYSQKGIRLTWSGAANADSYFVYRRGYLNPYTSATYLAPVGGGDISFTDWVTPGFSGGVITGQSYCYYIRSGRGSVKSTESNEACAMAP